MTPKEYQEYRASRSPKPGIIPPETEPGPENDLFKQNAAATAVLALTDITFHDPDGLQPDRWSDPTA